jgi:hypothetical protein
MPYIRGDEPRSRLASEHLTGALVCHRCSFLSSTNHAAMFAIMTTKQGNADKKEIWMPFQPDPDPITWRLHLRAAPTIVYAILATDEGRARRSHNI